MATNTVPKTKIKFYATGANLNLERVPPEETSDGRGNWTAKRGTGCMYSFNNGALEIDPEQDVLPTGPDGEDETALEWLRRHTYFGDRFFEIEPTPPSPDETLAEITRLTVKGDTEALAEIYDTEIDGYKRTAIISASESALRALEEKGSDST